MRNSGFVAPVDQNYFWNIEGLALRWGRQQEFGLGIDLKWPLQIDRKEMQSKAIYDTMQTFLRSKSHGNWEQQP